MNFFKPYQSAAPLAACALCFLLTGCKPSDMADDNVLAQARQYFPLAEISHAAPTVLTVDTHVANISEAFAVKVMATLLAEHQADLQLLPFVGYRAFKVQFANGACGWNVAWQFFRCGGGHAYSFYGARMPSSDYGASEEWVTEVPSPPDPPAPYLPQ